MLRLVLLGFFFLRPHASCLNLNSPYLQSACFLPMPAAMELRLELKAGFWNLVPKDPIRREAVASQKQVRNRQLLQAVHQAISPPGFNIWNRWYTDSATERRLEDLADPMMSEAKRPFREVEGKALSQWRLDYFASQAHVPPKTSELPGFLIRLRTQKGTLGLQILKLQEAQTFGRLQGLELRARWDRKSLNVRLPLTQIPLLESLAILNQDQQIVEIWPSHPLNHLNTAWSLLKTPLVLPASDD